MKQEADSLAFKSETLRTEYFTAYDEMLAKWPIRAEALDVETDFGVTHVNCAGPNGGKSLLLLPGYGSNSTTWYRNVGTLCASNRVYAVDLVGQPGRSVATKALDAATMSGWLTQLLDRLSIGKVQLAGWSLGGWIALDFAIRHPERTQRIALLDPAACFLPLSFKFAAATLITMASPTEKKLLRYFRWMVQGNAADKDYGKLTMLGILSSKRQAIVKMAPFSKDQLASCKVPVLVLVAEHGVVCDSERSMARATAALPMVHAEMIKEASHTLHIDQAERVNACLSSFFNG